MPGAAAAGAHSIFEFIRRTAEQVPLGIRWHTIDYQNRPHYERNVFNGCGGISVFLTEYHRQTGDATALDLAQGGCRWCMRTEEGSRFTRGLLTGKTGVALAALDIWRLVKEDEYLDFCHENARVIMKEDPGPVTDLMGGAAGNGLSLLRLWEATKSREYLQGAVRCGDWLQQHLTRDERGCHCIAAMDGRRGNTPITGVAHGIAGVAHFFLLLAEATHDEAWEGYGREILATLVAHAVPDRGGLNWSPRLGERELSRCQWSHGAAGVGLVFARAYQLSRDPSDLDVALRCGTTTAAYGDCRSNITQCIGLSGSGELFIELYRITEDLSWLDQARDFAKMTLQYREETPEGDAWPTDEPGLFSPDFMYGAAGAGHFFLRLQKPGEIRMPFM